MSTKSDLQEQVDSLTTQLTASRDKVADLELRLKQETDQAIIQQRNAEYWRKQLQDSNDALTKRLRKQDEGFVQTVQALSDLAAKAVMELTDRHKKQLADLTRRAELAVEYARTDTMREAFDHTLQTLAAQKQLTTG